MCSERTSWSAKIGKSSRNKRPSRPKKRKIKPQEWLTKKERLCLANLRELTAFQRTKIQILRCCRIGIRTPLLRMTSTFRTSKISMKGPPKRSIFKNTRNSTEVQNGSRKIRKTFGFRVRTTSQKYLLKAVRNLRKVVVKAETRKEAWSSSNLRTMLKISNTEREDTEWTWILK